MSLACGNEPATPQERPPQVGGSVGGAEPPPTVSGRVPVTPSGLPAIVVLEPGAGHPVPAPADPPVMDQAARTFLPPLLFARTGHPAEFRNSDEEMHNVNVKHGVTREQAFNVSVATGDTYRYAFAQPGLYDVACDVHAGMTAQIVVSGGPYATVADAEGRFAFSQVAPGRYTLVVYAGAEAIERQVDITGPVQLDLTGSGN